ncbi:MAG: hypothetical protein Q9187_005401 [Circinaria calcarea]
MLHINQAASPTTEPEQRNRSGTQQKQQAGKVLPIILSRGRFGREGPGVRVVIFKPAHRRSSNSDLHDIVTNPKVQGRGLGPKDSTQAFVSSTSTSTGSLLDRDGRITTSGTMSTIQNLKNFIRHGKQARASNSPHGDPTTNISPVHAQQQRHSGAQQQNHHGISEPNLADHKPLQAAHVPGGDYSVANMDNRNVVARAGGVAAKQVGDNQRIGNGGSIERKKDYDPLVIERIVAEERESKGKLPRYPGLERYRLIEKMGDGAFSNVYRAKDLNGEYDEVAVKVVRKFEMNSSQVSTECKLNPAGSGPMSFLLGFPRIYF